MKKKLVWINVLILSFFILDRILKKIALSGAVKKISFFEFSLFTNPNIALSIPLKGMLLYLLLIIILFYLASRLIRSYQRRQAINVLGFELVLVGALSNILDRLGQGLVIDYFNLPFFAAFNIADLMILVGLGVLAWRVITSTST